MKTIDFSYFIERYIAGEMDQSERKWFEMELEGNLSLQKELALRKKADAALIRHDIIDLRNKLAAIEKQRREKMVASGAGKTAGLRFAAAVAALMIIGGTYLISTVNQSFETIYRKNFMAYQSSAISRSGELKLSDFETARNFYNNNNYAQAASLLKKYLLSKPQSMEGNLLYGISEMENNNFQAAKASFRSIIDNSDNLYIDNAHWYLALCCIRANEKDEALTQLESIINSNSIYRDKARKISRKIR